MPIQLTIVVLCHCHDYDCPEHRGRICFDDSVITLYRVDMDDEDGTPMCEACANDALSAGVFTVETPGGPDDD